MSITPSEWQTHYYTMLLHPTETRILMLPGKDGWRLPSFDNEEWTHLSDAHLITVTVQRQLGIDANMLYCAFERFDRENTSQELIYVLEIRPAAWMPPVGSQWVGFDTLANLELTLPEQRAIIATCLHDSEEVPPLRPPWARRGWLVLAEKWIREQLASLSYDSPSRRETTGDHEGLPSHSTPPSPLREDISSGTTGDHEGPPSHSTPPSPLREGSSSGRMERLNYAIIDAIEQVKIWGISCVLRVPTTHGNVYFKANLTSSGQTYNPNASSDKKGILPLLFAHEPLLITSLAAWYPQIMPRVLAMDKERCWMLLSEFGTLLYEHPDKTAWEKALAVYGQMQVQVAATHHIDTLFAIGCLDRRLHILETQIDPLLHDEDVLADLNGSEVEQLRAYGARLKSMCDELANCVIPQTLVHGDLHTGNIAVQNDNYIYFDWSDGCVAHPFFDVLTFMENIDDPKEQTRLREIYLAQWTDYAPMEDLREIFPLSQMLATIHQAVSYQHIIAHMEGTSKQAMRGGATYWLRILLRLMEAVI